MCTDTQVQVVPKPMIRVPKNPGSTQVCTQAQVHTQPDPDLDGYPGIWLGPLKCEISSLCPFLSLGHPSPSPQHKELFDAAKHAGMDPSQAFVFVSGKRSSNVSILTRNFCQINSSKMLGGENVFGLQAFSPSKTPLRAP